MARLSVQESLYPKITCFGCGHANPDGFHLRSFEDGARVIATFRPRSIYSNGYGFVNGGIITTLLDCHTAAAVMLEAHRRGLRDPDGSFAKYVTAGFEVRFVRPTPLERELSLTAQLVSAEDDTMICDAELRLSAEGDSDAAQSSVDAKVRATMRATWKRYRAR